MRQGTSLCGNQLDFQGKKRYCETSVLWYIGVVKISCFPDTILLVLSSDQMRLEIRKSDCVPGLRYNLAEVSRLIFRPGSFLGTIFANGRTKTVRDKWPSPTGIRIGGLGWVGERPVRWPGTTWEDLGGANQAQSWVPFPAYVSGFPPPSRQNTSTNHRQIYDPVLNQPQVNQDPCPS